MAWGISLHEEVERWYLDLCQHDPDTADLVAAAIDLLAETDPPWADRCWWTASTAVGTTTVHGSRHHNMKGLRPASTGSREVRLLFAFDPDREALVLVAGDKSGRWQAWYPEAIPVADHRFDEHLAALQRGIPNQAGAKSRRTQGPQGGQER